MSFGRKKRDENGWIIEDPNKPATAGKTENFFTRNVKLITFLVCIAIFLTFFGPITIFKVIDYINELRDPRVPMTQEDLVALSELDRDLYFSDIEGFKGTKDIKSSLQEVDGVVTEVQEIYYFINIGTDFSALVIAEIDTEKITYFMVSNNDNQWKADLLKDDIRSFVQGIPVPTEPESSSEAASSDEPTTENTKDTENK